MNINAHHLTAVFALAMLTAGCGNTGTGVAPQPHEPAEPTEPEASEPEAIGVEVYDWVSQQPVAGAEVCVRGGVCVDTDEAGLATFELEEDAAYVFEYSGAGYRPHLFAVRWAGQVEVWRLTLVSEAFVEDVEASTGVTLDPARGAIGVSVFDGDDQGVGGAQVRLRSAEADGPFYWLDEGMSGDVDVTNSAVPAAALLNVEVGEVELTIDHPERGCVNLYSPAGKDWDAQVLPVEPGTITMASNFTCYLLPQD